MRFYLRMVTVLSSCLRIHLDFCLLDSEGHSIMARLHFDDACWLVRLAIIKIAYTYITVRFW